MVVFIGAKRGRWLIRVANLCEKLFFLFFMLFFQLIVAPNPKHTPQPFDTKYPRCQVKPDSLSSSPQGRTRNDPYFTSRTI